MRWDYRIIKSISKDSGKEYYVLKAVDYDAFGAIASIDEDIAFPVGNNVNELRRDIKLMQRAFKKDIVDENNVIFGITEGTMDE